MVKIGPRTSKHRISKIQTPNLRNNCNVHVLHHLFSIEGITAPRKNLDISEGNLVTK